MDFVHDRLPTYHAWSPAVHPAWIWYVDGILSMTWQDVGEVTEGMPVYLWSRFIQRLRPNLSRLLRGRNRSHSKGCGVRADPLHSSDNRQSTYTDSSTHTEWPLHRRRGLRNKRTRAAHPTTWARLWNRAKGSGRRASAELSCASWGHWSASPEPHMAKVYRRWRPCPIVWCSSWRYSRAEVSPRHAAAAVQEPCLGCGHRGSSARDGFLHGKDNVHEDLLNSANALLDGVERNHCWGSFNICGGTNLRCTGVSLVGVDFEFDTPR